MFLIVLSGCEEEKNRYLPAINEALKYCGASSNAMGYDLADTAGILGKFADQGLKGSNAGEELRLAV